ncbi:hypothetical protein M8C21_013745 [Ambrosia artemisiifolia]|uniref:Plectin/eS10 N-terminal domain-containing protein n=1 Tax=Ambrosia artemisiifolia TaxID=4212 RepID=A0AAD5G869_AMBAR|nr:hypothetical protein M8C21_013745 [Ambrosia artemisiifolia]
MHYYWYLTNDGIEFLRTYLNLPSDIVPATLKKSAKPLGRPTGGHPGALVGCQDLKDIGLGLVIGMVIAVDLEGLLVGSVAKRVELQLITGLLLTG